MVKNKMHKKEASEIYELMLLIRKFEEKAGQLYGMGLIGGFCHLYIGQEAVAAGIRSIMTKEDKVITTYRDHGHMIAMNSDPKKIMAELLGKKDGSSKGKGGSMHLFDLANNFYGGHGIVGASVPIGTGIAFAQKYQGSKGVCFCYFGDGALHQGQVYESFNMAKLWNLPIIYIIENNNYAMGTSVQRSSSISELYKRGESFNIKGIVTDGMDVIDVMEKGAEALKYVHDGNGPILIEAKTYRYRGHSMSDPATYRSRKEVDDMKQSSDPINKFKEYVLNNSILNEKEIQKINEKIKDQINDIVEFAKNSPQPEAEELFTDVYR